MGTSENYYYRTLSYSIIIITYYDDVFSQALLTTNSVHSMRVWQMVNSFSMFNHVRLKKSQLSISTSEITSLEFNSMDGLPRLVES